MANTTSKGITYPTSGDNIAPLETHFATLATTTDAAIDTAVAGIDMSSITTGLLPIANGGTNASTIINAAKNLDVVTNGAAIAGKNKLLNGNFDILQRVQSGVTSGYVTDRWYSNTLNRITYSNLSSGNTTYLQALYAATGTAGAGVYLTQALESKEVNLIQGKTVTFSFKVRRNSAYTTGIIGYIESGNTVDVVSSGTWTVLKSTTATSGGIPTTSSWATVIVTTAVPAGTTALRVTIGEQSRAANGAYFEISEAQLEIGSNKTQFSRAAGTYEQELAACQRFYYSPLNGVSATDIPVCNAYTTSTTQAFATMELPVTMRTPTLSTSGTTVGSFSLGYGNIGGNFVATGISVTKSTQNRLFLTVTTAGTMTANMSCQLYRPGTTALFNVNAELP